MVFYQISDLPVFKNPVITIGSFDGVHHGHKIILQEVVKAAKAINGESILITFDPHPRKIISPDESIGLLSSPNKKYELVQAAGIDHIVVVPFTRDFSMLSAEEYVMDFLYKNFQPHKIIIGYDHRFGHSREGDINLLRSLLPSSVIVQEIAPQLIENAAVSSSKIRTAILENNVEEAAEMLERYYSYEGTVVKGDGIGNKLGFPTANIMPNCSDVLLPAIGVYAVVVRYKGVCYKGMLNMGVRPTINDAKKITCEVNIFDFNQDIYGRKVDVYFIKPLRAEMKFSGLDALIAQLQQDKINAVLALESIVLQDF